MDAGSLEDALSTQKYYSDYFSTTEAENIIEESAAPSQKKVTRKKKKVIPKTMDKTEDNSDSEDDTRGMYFAYLLYFCLICLGRLLSIDMALS